MNKVDKYALIQEVKKIGFVDLFIWSNVYDLKQAASTIRNIGKDRATMPDVNSEWFKERDARAERRVKKLINRLNTYPRSSAKWTFKIEFFKTTALLRVYYTPIGGKRTVLNLEAL